MIDAIILSKAATFNGKSQVLDKLSQFNYFFGSNGTGKTTISRLIADKSQFPNCSIQWKSYTPLESLVYNQDYIEKNFDQSEHLKGVFTLGKQQKDTLDRINDLKIEIDNIDEKILGLKKQLEGDGTEENTGKRAEMNQLEEWLKDKCWVQKQKYDDFFKDAFKGVRNNSENFKYRVKQELSSNQAELKNLEHLKNRANTVFGEEPLVVDRISEIDFTTLLGYETEPILNKVVVGKDDVDIAEMIKKLGNSDWVKEGIIYFETNNGICPFCQQKTYDSFAQSLNEYFDETFNTNTKTINELNINYKKETNRIVSILEQIISVPSDFIDLKAFEAEKKVFDSKIAVNTQKLINKQKQASQIISLDSMESIASEISRLISEANMKIDNHNEMVRNLSTERITLTSQVWKYILEELKNDFKDYYEKKSIFDKAIAGMEEGIKIKNVVILQKKQELRNLEKQMTSMVPTRDSINALLNSFGFQGFRLEIVENTNFYKLVRPDGSDAKNTLSEGERTFITFLYFYHLLKGSESETGMTTNRVVVFDDPVSSLDSDILFIVSSLIKGLMTEVRNNIGTIKQIFVLTHNVYFHKEITFNPKRCDTAMNEETFWVVRKSDSISIVERQLTNPIKTSYDLLWSEIRRNDRSNLTIQNILRRVLENYFKILGDIDPDDICDKFESKEKMICKSLFSWVNDGSHFAMDDLYISIDDAQVDMYLNVFKKIFEKTGQIAHYNMMMGKS